MKFKCKPTWNFQSIEFEWEIEGNVDTKTQYDKMIECYAMCLKSLMEIAPEQPEKTREPLASDSQKQIMKNYGIEFDKNTTAKQAQELIKQSIEKAKKAKKK